MLPLIGTGLLSLLVYGIFTWKFPKPEKVLTDKFCLNTLVINGTNIINPDPKTWVQSGKEQLRVYKFNCIIQPNKANLAGTEVDMKIPDEYTINQFSILTDPETNEVLYVHLGQQYHCDKDPISNCVCLSELYRENLDYRFMESLLELLSRYDLFDSYCQDHWDNDVFVKSNSKLTAKMQEIIKTL